MNSTSTRALAILIAFLAAAPPGAVAAPAPGPAALERLHAAAGSWNRFRVRTGRGVFELSKLRADSAGVLLESMPRRPALQVRPGSVPGDPGRALWSEIERVEGSRSRPILGMSRGIVIGGLIGLAGAVAISSTPAEVAPGTVVGVLSLGLATGGIVGGALGSASKWTLLYP